MDPQTLVNSSTCELTESFMDTIDFPVLPADSQTRLEEILNRTIKASCITDLNPILQELLTKLNVNALLNEVNGLDISSLLWASANKS